MKEHPSTDTHPTRILVFALYKKEAQRLEQTIKRNGFSVMGLHGDMDQNARFKALDAFKEGKVNILVATDVAARGLDVSYQTLIHLAIELPLTLCRSQMSIGSFNSTLQMIPVITSTG